LKEQPRYRLEAIDIIPDLIKEEHLFESYSQCVDWVAANVKDVIDEDGNPTTIT
jgi:SulP family sulfate permease